MRPGDAAPNESVLAKDSSGIRVMAYRWEKVEPEIDLVDVKAGGNPKTVNLPIKRIPTD